MSDIFCEAIVAKKQTTDVMIKKAALIALTAVLFFAAIGMMITILLLPAILLVCLDIFLFKSWNIEYEYAITGTDLDIAKIMSKERRKSLHSFDLKKAELIAPSNNYKVKDLERNAKVLDYTSREEGRDLYVILIRDEKNFYKVLVEPTQDMLKAMRQIAPSVTIL